MVNAWKHRALFNEVYRKQVTTAPVNYGLLYLIDFLFLSIRTHIICASFFGIKDHRHFTLHFCTSFFVLVLSITGTLHCNFAHVSFTQRE